MIFYAEIVIFINIKHQNNRKKPSEIHIFRLKYTYIGIFLFQKTTLLPLVKKLME